MVIKPPATVGGNGNGQGSGTRSQVLEGGGSQTQTHAGTGGGGVGSQSMPIDVQETGGRGQVNDGDVKNVWNYGFKVGQGFRCGFCGHVHKSGGATRLREHLGGIPGNVSFCIKVSPEVRETMRIAHSMGIKKRRDKNQLKQRIVNELIEEVGGSRLFEKVPSDEEGQIQMALARSAREVQFGHSLIGSTSGQTSRASSAAGSGSIQPRIDAVMNQGNVEKMAKAWSRWFHANDIAGIKADCPYFRAALRVTQQVGVTARIVFHKAVNASGESQNAEFLFNKIKGVVDEIGHEFIVQIITDNGANYKRACQMVTDEYNHIVWQPCAAHTINLLLGDIGRFSEIADVIKSARRVCSFFYNHNRLHEEMKKKIGGELVRPNATRFGTNFMFLQSFSNKKDMFRQWMVSEEWRDNSWNNDPEYHYAEGVLLDNNWWDALKFALDVIEPFYVVLRYADEDNGTMSGFMAKMMNALRELEQILGSNTEMYKRYMSKISPRVRHLYDDTLMVAAAVLDPVGHYYLHLSDNYDYCTDLQEAIERIQDNYDSGLKALTEFEAFKNLSGKFGGTMARKAVGEMSATNWWIMFGGDAKELQKYAVRIVSQCVSSSGCERNWSAFALVHTKVRNSLGYDKLNKLVYVHYNLKLRLKEEEMENGNRGREREIDPCALIIDAALYDESNPIMQWLNKHSNEDADISLEQICARLRKRKGVARGRKGKAKKSKSVMESAEDELDVGTYSSSDSPSDSPCYAESSENSSTKSSDHGEESENQENQPIEESSIRKRHSKNRKTKNVMSLMQK